MDVQTYLHGGGTRLAAHLGALKALEAAGVNVVHWAGASAGSLVAAVSAAGFRHNEAVDLMLNTDYRRFLDRSTYRMIRDYGLCSGKRFEKWLDGVLGGARFASLDAPLSVVATEMSTGNAHVFSPRTTPDMKIATAVRCSIGIPGIFAARRIGGEMFVDGALSVIDPSTLFPPVDLPSVLVRLRTDAHAPFARRERLGPAAYIHRSMEILLRNVQDHCNPGWFTHDLQIQVGSHLPMAFHLTAEDKQSLYDGAFRQATAALTGTPIDAPPRSEPFSQLDPFDDGFHDDLNGKVRGGNAAARESPGAESVGAIDSGDVVAMKRY